MSESYWRVYVGRGRLPRDFVAKVHAPSAEAALAWVRKQPALRVRDLDLQAVPAHQPRKPGK